MSHKTSFLYREFYDVPRMIILRRGDSLILLESAFDIAADDYSNSYGVYVLPDIRQDELDGSWEGLRARATKFLGHILVREVEFDPTLRKEIDPALIDDLLREYFGQEE